MVIHSAFFFILLLISFMFSVAHAAYKSPVEIVNILGMIIFLVGVSLYSYYQGRKNNRKYTKFILGYIIVIAVTYIIAGLTKVYYIAILFFFNMVSMYPITYFLEGYMNSSLVMILPFILEFFLIFTFYYIGKYITKRKSD